MTGWLSRLWYQFNFCVAYCIYTFLFGLRSTGSRNMPRKGAVLVIANHESFLDPQAVGLAVRRRLNFLARKTLFKNPFFGSFLRSVGCVPVDQVGVAKEGLRKCMELLQSGETLLIFPEGERTWTGTMNPFKPGILLLLKRTPVTIVPVGIAGGHETFPRGAKLPRLSPLLLPPTGNSLALSVGKPIEPHQYADLGRDEILTFLARAIAEEVKRAEKLVLKPV